MSGAPAGGGGPLEGVLVADFSRVLGGPYATMLLGDLGATVIKIEPPDAGDGTRAWGPPWSGPTSTYFQSVNRNKRSVRADLNSTEDQRLAAALCRRADIVVENFLTGTMDRFGLGPGAVLADNPAAVYCSITGFGPRAGAELAGYDLLVQATGGLMSVTGEPEGPPMRTGVAVVDVITGLHALTAILAALRHRDRTGRGQHVEVSLLTSLLSGLVNQTSAYLNAGVVPSAMGNRHPSVVPYELVPAADRPFVLAVGTDHQFAVLCQELARPELVDDPRFSTNGSRVIHRDELIELLAEAFGRAPAAEWVDRLSARGVPCGLVNRMDEAIALAERLDLEPVVEQHDPAGRATRSVRHPASYSDSPVAYRAAPPAWQDVEPITSLASWLTP